MLAYLAGAIEYAPDGGRGWRREIGAFLRDGLAHAVYDPAEDERKSLSEEEQRNLRAWKTADLGRFQQAVRKIIAFDLDVVRRADYVVCFWDESGLRGGGTSAEVTFAHIWGVPVYLVSSLPIQQLSGWVLGCCSEVFRDFAGLKGFLRKRYAPGAPAEQRAEQPSTRPGAPNEA